MNPPRDSKSRALRKQGALHARPEQVRDPLFQHSEFFDPRDLVLVKYEMLRRVRVDGQSAAATARAFGFSRVAFYQARGAFQQEGLPGLLPRRRGPKQASKLTAPVLEFIDQQRTADSHLHAPELARLIRRHLRLTVHPRTIERALARRTKKGQRRASS
ncbi:MAG TPA: helix-turn-helix domain-containing protein [Phycisphaerae bacterium]|nr:helix-turn-helix domain-containing protein [Phycisphaerae bacterium]